MQKYAEFVDLLLRKTKESKIPWNYDSGRNTIYVWNGPVLLNVVRSQDDNYEDVYSVSLINKSGDYLESFSDDVLSSMLVDLGEDNYFTRMKETYNLAMRQATGADKALDDFMRAVRGDELDSPF